MLLRTRGAWSSPASSTSGRIFSKRAAAATPTPPSSPAYTPPHSASATLGSTTTKNTLKSTNSNASPSFHSGSSPEKGFSPSSPPPERPRRVRSRHPAPSTSSSSTSSAPQEATESVWRAVWGATVHKLRRFFLWRVVTESKSTSEAVARVMVSHRLFLPKGTSRQPKDLPSFDRAHAHHFALSEALLLSPLVTLIGIHYVSVHCRYPTRHTIAVHPLLAQLQEQFVWENVCLQFIQTVKEPALASLPRASQSSRRKYLPSLRVGSLVSEENAQLLHTTWFRASLLLSKAVCLPFWSLAAVLAPHWVHAVLAHANVLLRDRYAGLPAIPSNAHTGTIFSTVQSSSTPASDSASLTTSSAVPPLSSRTTNSDSERSQETSERGDGSRFPLPTSRRVKRVHLRNPPASAAAFRSADHSPPHTPASSSASSSSGGNPTMPNDKGSSTSQKLCAVVGKADPLELAERLARRIQCCDDGAQLHVKLSQLPPDIFGAALLLNVLILLFLLI